MIKINIKKLRKIYRQKTKKLKKPTEKPKRTINYTIKKDTAPGQRNNTRGILTMEYIEHTPQGTKTRLGNPYYNIIYQNKNYNPTIDISTETSPTLGYKRIHPMNSFELGDTYE